MGNYPVVGVSMDVTDMFIELLCLTDTRRAFFKLSLLTAVHYTTLSPVPPRSEERYPFFPLEKTKSASVILPQLLDGLTSDSALTVKQMPESLHDFIQASLANHSFPTFLSFQKFNG